MLFRSLAGQGRVAYHVYDVTTDGAERRLTTAAVDGPAFVDARMAWGEARCYVVRAIVIVNDRAAEGDPSPRQCVTLVDTFPPAAPKGLTAIAGEGSVNLLWEANGEADLAGYRVLRDLGATGVFEAVTPELIKETTFREIGRAHV